MKLVLRDLVNATVGGCRRSGTQEGSRYDGDAVASAVGVAAGGDDDGVEQVGAEALAEPVEVAHVVVGDGGGDLDFDGDDPSVAPLVFPPAASEGAVRPASAVLIDGGRAQRGEVDAIVFVTSPLAPCVGLTVVARFRPAIRSDAATRPKVRAARSSPFVRLPIACV